MSETDWEKMNLEEEVSQLEKRYIKKEFSSIPSRTVINLGFTLNPSTTYYVYLKGGDDLIALYYNGETQGQYSFLKNDNIITITTGLEPEQVVIYSNTNISSPVEMIFSLETGIEDIITSIVGDKNNIEGDISDIVNGKYITINGSLNNYSFAKYGIIQLNKGDLIEIIADGNSQVSILSETNAEGTVFLSLFAGKGDITQTQISNFLYIIKKKQDTMLFVRQILLFLRYIN